MWQRRSPARSWLPAPGAPANQGRERDPAAENHLMSSFWPVDIGCLLFGRTTSRPPVPSSITTFDLRQINLPIRNLFHGAACHAGGLSHWTFDRIAAFPMASLPTATGLSLQLAQPLDLSPQGGEGPRRPPPASKADFQEGEKRGGGPTTFLITGGSRDSMGYSASWNRPDWW